ncbi:MAG: trimethylamine methyltransferase family protein, partial [Candidatus Heimdallarchaeota archaeon]
MTILRPNVKLLDEEHKSRIVNEAKLILESQGVFIENKDAIDLFIRNGFPRKGSRFLIPSDLVDKCLKTVPNEIKLYDREGYEHITLKDDNVHYDPGSAAILFLDENTGEIRDAHSKDFKRFSKIVEHLNFIDAQSTALIYQDVPKEAQDWHRLYIALSNCYKPVITGTFRKESFTIMKEIL